VGLSRNQERDSYRVGAYLRKHGFRIIPVNPSATEILGERSYKSLLDIPVEVQKVIDIVDIFRPSEDVPLIVEQSIKLKERHGKPQVVWTQLGITNEDAAKAAETAGIAVVMNKCIMIEHTHLS
jgi:predicted CoA-binding protein